MRPRRSASSRWPSWPVVAVRGSTYARRGDGLHRGARRAAYGGVPGLRRSRGRHWIPPGRWLAFRTAAASRLNGLRRRPHSARSAALSRRRSRRAPGRPRRRRRGLAAALPGWPTASLVHAAARRQQANTAQFRQRQRLSGIPPALTAVDDPCGAHTAFKRAARSDACSFVVGRRPPLFGDLLSTDNGSPTVSRTPRRPAAHRRAGPTSQMVFRTRRCRQR